MGNAVARLFLLSIFLLLFTGPTALAQNSVAANDASDTPEPIEVTTDPNPTSIPDFHHRLLLNNIPGLAGQLKFLSSLSDDAIVRALLTIDGKLLALPLKREQGSAERVGAFPTPFKSLEYQFQISDSSGSRLSPRYTANPHCAADPTPTERWVGENEIVKNIQLLRNDSALLSATIDRIHLILGTGQ